MTDFERDDKWQKRMRDTVLAPGFYGNYAVEGRYVFLDKGALASLLQKRHAVDTILQGRDGSAVCIEEKIVRWPGHRYECFALETDSCTKPGYESKGWMHYGHADFLLYAFCQDDDSLDVHLIDFPKLQAWFWPRVENFSVFGPLDTLNRSKGRVVPIKAVHENVPAWRRHVRAPEMGAVA
jgi:hypothetical protein